MEFVAVTVLLFTWLVTERERLVLECSAVDFLICVAFHIKHVHVGLWNLLVARHLILIRFESRTRTCHRVDYPEFLHLAVVFESDCKMLRIGTPNHPLPFALSVGECIGVEIAVRHSETEVLLAELSELGLHDERVEFLLVGLLLVVLHGVVLELFVVLARHLI